MKNKIVSSDKLKDVCTIAREKGKKIVFTNGCFDLLHVGHVRYLAKARSLGDILVVGVNTDRSVRFIKGEGRPIMSEKERVELLASLVFVDYVSLFDEPDPLNLIEIVRPEVLVKGSDWEEKEIIGADFVKGYGGKVVRVPLISGVSTTKIIEKILGRFKN